MLLSFAVRLPPQSDVVRRILRMRRAIIAMLVAAALIALVSFWREGAAHIRHLEEQAREIRALQAEVDQGDAWENNDVKARAAYQRGDWGTALRLWRSVARQAQEANRCTAAVVRSFASLGHLYYCGQGTPQDHVQAMRWFEMAAHYDLPDALQALGVMYEHGEGVRRDAVKAASWFRKAADYGVGSAQYDLGLMYREGRGVPVDYVLAYKWENLAAVSEGFSASASRAREDVEVKMSPGQVAEAQRLAREWTPRDFEYCTWHSWN
jgi:TPR repeat protein